MAESISTLDEPADFSLVQGGPLFQLLMRLRLVRPPMKLRTRRIIVISLIAWLPLLLLSIVEGHAVSGIAVPFLLDLGAQARFLVTLPLLIGAEVLVHDRIKGTVRQFIDRGIVTPEDRPLFEGCITSALKLRNSTLAEVVLLALAIFGGYWAGKRYVNMQAATWFMVTSGGQSRITLAGYWYFVVSFTILRFLLMRWMFRFAVWYRFLWQVSRRVPLRLNALHPDQAAGLGFLSVSAFALQPVLLAVACGHAGIIGNKIWYEGARLTQFKLEIAGWIVFLILLVVGPLFCFASRLAKARREGIREYGQLATRYVFEFRRKWLEGHEPEGEPLLGASDIQSLADLSNSFSVVREMGYLPFGRSTVLWLAMLTALPFAPLMLTMISLEQLVDHVLGVFL